MRDVWVRLRFPELFSKQPLSLLILLLVLLSPVWVLAQSAADLLREGDQEFAAGKFEAAAKKYRAAMEAEPANLHAHYWLVRALLREDDTTEALAVIEQGLKADVESPLLLTGMGEVRYRMAEFEAARTAFLAALARESNLPRARLGLGEILLSEARYKSAKFHLQRAYELDPNDPEIILAWAQTFNGGPEQVRLLQRYLDLAKKEPAGYLDHVRSYKEFLEKRENPGLCTLAQGTLPAKIDIQELDASGLPKRDEFRTISPASRRSPAPFLEVRANGGKPQTMLLDTGASGILLNERYAKQAGIRPITAAVVGGIGSAGNREAYLGMADKIRIGSLEFRSCVVRVTNAQHLPRDGIVGADFFSPFLITLDLPNLAVRLEPHPEAQAIAEKPDLIWNYDRKVPPERAEFERVRRTGGHLLIGTRINQAHSGWFLMDTGASINSVSLVTAKKATRTTADPYTQVQGVSGRTGTYEGESITVQFASFRQANFRIITLDLRGLARSKGFEVAGLLGYPTLRMFTLQIDYLNALVKFDYKPPR